MTAKKIGFLSFLFCLVLVRTSAQQNPLLQVQTLKLDNGFTVFLNEDPSASKVFGAVMVNAGAKHESPDATGMAHYLEHLLFKGTRIMGTTDYEKEKPHLDSIVYLYDRLPGATPEERAEIQKTINGQALKAAEYGLPNEFDKLLRSIGGTGINAFTNSEMTFYHNSFPAHEIGKWLDIYATRFQNPVFRSFQSELEVVYEEKNRSMDNFTGKIFEKFQSMLFPNHPYGEWPVLGTVEHLKNPSLSKMYAFYNKHYVAKNMALILSGNFKSETVIPLIRQKFGALKADPYTPVKLPPPTPIQGVHTEYVHYTPVKVGLIGYQTAPQNHPDRKILDICEYLLFNKEETGYLNKLQTNGEIMYCGAFPIVYNDAGGIFLFFVPKILSQSFGNAEAKVQQAFASIREGRFTDEQLRSAKYNLIKSFQQELESVDERGVMIGQAFNAGIPWEEHLQYPEKINRITREEVVRVAQKYYGDNYVRLVSKTGFPKNPKLEKPPYKAVVTEQKGESAYAAGFAKLPSMPFTPRFIDFKKDIQQQTLEGGHTVYAAKNPVNDLFYMELRYKTGKLKNPVLESAVNFINFCGAGSHSLDELKSAFAAIGCSYHFSCTNNFVVLELEGKEANLKPGLELAYLLLSDPRPGPKAKSLMLNETKTSRKFEKRTPDFIGRCLLYYAMLGKDSPFLKRDSEKHMAATPESEWTAAYKNITAEYAADILYTGSIPAAELGEALEAGLHLGKKGRADEFVYNEGLPVKNNMIYFVNDKKAVQSQIYFYVPGEKSETGQFGDAVAFNEYFSGGFSGLVLQEIREYRSLAYSTGGSYSLSSVPDKKARLVTYVGCQADKSVEAIGVMVSLITDMPLKEDRMADLQKALLTKVSNAYPEFRQLAETVVNYRRQGFSEDPNKKAYADFAHFTSADIRNFYEKNIRNKPYAITIYGDKSRIDLTRLKQFGTVVELSQKDFVVF